METTKKTAIKKLHESSSISSNTASFERIVSYNGMKFRLFADIDKGSTRLCTYGNNKDGGISIFSPSNGWVQIEDYETLNCNEEFAQVKHHLLYHHPTPEEEIGNVIGDAFKKFEAYIKKVF